MKRILLLTIVICSLTTCQKTNDKLETESPIDPLLNNFISSWNNNDSITAKNMFASDAIVFDDNIIAKNHEELMSNWIRPLITTITNVQMEKTQEWVTEDLAGCSGFWSIDILHNDSVAASYKGVMTFIWILSEKGEWKISHAHLHSFYEDEDMNEDI